jgi:hypothetical protein
MGHAAVGLQAFAILRNGIMMSLNSEEMPKIATGYRPSIPAGSKFASAIENAEYYGRSI